MQIPKKGMRRRPYWLRWACPFLMGQVPRRRRTDERSIYLTFDDGPTSGVTEEVLDVLDSHQVCATFFCVGKSAEQHPDLVQKIVDAGHRLGNHTYSHCNGWSVSSKTYLHEAHQCNQVLESIVGKSVDLFRPPYGKMRATQWLALRHRWECWMWDVSGHDFVESLNPKDIEQSVMEHVRPGSIILLHDSPLGAPRMLPALPKILERLLGAGYRFECLPQRVA